MIGYIIRRLMVAVIVVIGIAVISFAMLHYLRRRPAYACSEPRRSRRRSTSWNKQHGYDRPEIAQFFSYLGNLPT